MGMCINIPGDLGGEEQYDVPPEVLQDLEEIKQKTGLSPEAQQAEVEAIRVKHGLTLEQLKRAIHVLFFGSRDQNEHRFDPSLPYDDSPGPFVVSPWNTGKRPRPGQIIAYGL